MKTRFSGLKPLAILMAAAFSCAAVYAEAPMITDDAGTLDKGGKKIEGGFAKSGSTRAYGLSGGFSPIDNVELGLGLQHFRDSSVPASGNITALSAKWIPFKSGIYSAGLKLDYAHSRSGGASGNATTVTALGSARFESGYVLHANIGRTNNSGGGGHSNNWAIGGEAPVADKVQLTLDIYSSTGSDTGKQIGARWEVQKGLKLSAGFGRYNSENTFTAGFSWEF
jgi:hypothetical protein